MDVAPWPVFDEPEAALTASAASLDRNFSDDLARPNDVVYEPVGVRVRIVRLERDGNVAFVRAVGATWEGYAPVDRLVPEVPPGTKLRAAGGFGGFADFFRDLRTPESDAQRIATGTGLVVLGMAAAPYDPGNGDLVRLSVRVTSGSLSGRTGWIAAAYTGIPLGHVPATTDVAAEVCVCRIVRFEGRIDRAPIPPHHSR